jgi:hypothetical protein
VRKGATTIVKKINTKHGEGNNIKCRKGSINEHEEANNSECEKMNNIKCKEESNN